MRGTFLAQELAYFDHPRNNIGALTTRLATDASLVKGVQNSFPCLPFLDLNGVVCFYFHFEPAILL